MSAEIPEDIEIKERQEICICIMFLGLLKLWKCSFTSIEFDHLYRRKKNRFYKCIITVNST